MATITTQQPAISGPSPTKGAGLSSLPEPRSLIPLKFSEEMHPYLKNYQLTKERVKEVILKSDGLRSTYLFAGFDKIVVTEKVPASAVMLHKKTRRLALMINPRFIKTAILARLSERRHRKYPNKKRSQDFLKYKTVDELTYVEENALREIITQEFSHIWFQHLERNSQHSELMTSVIHVALLAHHVKLDPKLTTFFPAKSKKLFHAAIMFPSWIWGLGRYMSETQLYEMLVKKKYDFAEDDKHYLARRCYEALKANSKMQPKMLVNKFYAFAKAVAGYEEQQAQLIERLLEMFPTMDDDEDDEDDFFRPPPRRPPVAGPCGGTPGASAQSSDTDEDEDEEQEQQDGNKQTELPEDETEDEQEPEAEQEQEPEEETKDDEGLPYQIDPNKEELDHDGERFLPLGENGVPPDMDEHLEGIMKAVGASGKFTTALVGNVREAQLKRETIKAVMKVSTKSLLRFAKQAMDLKLQPNPVARTIIPNRHPVVSDMVLNNSLMLGRAPRYKPIRPREDDIRRRKVRLYIDVSGSMENAWEDIVAFAVGLNKHCDLECFQFSTDIVPVTIKELKQGSIKSWMGTNVDAIVRDIMEHSTICDAFTIIGDRHYGGAAQITKVAKPITILDIAYNTNVEAPFFQPSDRCAVSYVNLDRDFKVLKEGRAERT